MKALILLLTLGCLPLIISCDSKEFSCLDADGPRFETTYVEPAMAGEPYEARIVTYLKREPYDDSFDYHFELEGELPEGLYLEHEVHSRYIYIKGTTSTPGEYKFTFQVLVQDHPKTYEELFDPDHDEDGGLCKTTAKKSYTLIVEEPMLASHLTP